MYVQTPLCEHEFSRTPIEMAASLLQKKTCTCSCLHVRAPSKHTSAGAPQISLKVGSHHHHPSLPRRSSARTRSWSCDVGVPSNHRPSQKTSTVLVRTLSWQSPKKHSTDGGKRAPLPRARRSQEITITTRILCTSDNTNTKPKRNSLYSFVVAVVAVVWVLVVGCGCGCGCCGCCGCCGVCCGVCVLWLCSDVCLNYMGLSRHQYGCIKFQVPCPCGNTAPTALHTSAGQ